MEAASGGEFVTHLIFFYEQWSVFVHLFCDDHMSPVSLLRRCLLVYQTIHWVVIFDVRTFLQARCYTRTPRHADTDIPDVQEQVGVVVGWLGDEASARSREEVERRNSWQT